MTATITVVKTEYHYASVQLDVDRFTPDFEFVTDTYSDGSVEVSYSGVVVAEGTVGDDFDYGDLAHEVRWWTGDDFA
jgi:hypothetical protein